MTTSNSAPRERRRIHGPDELVQAIPYLLGFHPTDSMVFVALDRGELVVTARLDLDDLATACAPALLDHTVGAAAASGAGEFVVVVYSDGPDSDAPSLPAGVTRLAAGRGAARVSAPWLPGAGTVDAARYAVDGVGATLLDAVLVRGGRAWSYFCTSSCCPPEGREQPDAPSEFVVAATIDGTVAARDRATATASLDPWPDAERAALCDELAAAERAAVAAIAAGRGQRQSRSDRRALFAAARACHEPGWVTPQPRELARLAVALRSIDTRDAVWLAIEDGRLDGRPLMRELARRCPVPYDSAPSFLYGWACWRSGNSMLAGVAADRAMASDPACTAAQMLASAIEHALDPRAVPRIRRRPVRDRRRTGRPDAAVPTAR